MSSLNLRVASVKSDEIVKKNSEVRTTLMKLPEVYLKNKTEIMGKFLMAKTIPEQVNFVQNIFQENISNKDVLQFLANLYFFGPLKHPVRNQIVKLLKKDQKDIIVEVLKSSMASIIEQTKENSSLNVLNTVITSLSGCFENFPQALEAFKQTLNRIFSVLHNSLIKYLQELSIQISPSIKNEYYFFLHNSIRVLLSCIQEFSNILINELMQNELEELKSIAFDIMIDLDIPMDTKTNSGILTAYIYKICNNSDEFMKTIIELSKNNDNDCLNLCLCIGFINTLDNKLIIDHIEFILKCIEIVITTANNRSTEPLMLLSSTRIIFQLSKSILLCDLKSSCFCTVKIMLKKLLEYVLSYLEYHMDSIRHISKDILRHILKIEDKYKFEDLITELFGYCKSNEISLSIKCCIIMCTGEIFGITKVLQQLPNLFDDIFQFELGQDLNVNNCYEKLMIGHSKEIDFDIWKTIWIEYLIKFALTNKSKLIIVENLINKSIKCQPKIMGFLIDENILNIPLSTRLSAFWTIRKTGIFIQDFEKILENSLDTIKLAVISHHDNTRIMALRLIVETHKTTAPITKLEFDCYLLYLKYNSNPQNPATREKSLALLMKFLLRFEINIKKILKQQKISIKGEYMGFLKSLLNLLTENLFAGANFSRRLITLNLLKQILEICNKVQVLCKNNILPKPVVNLLENALNDSYEMNKLLAVNILKLIPIEIQNPICLKTIHELIISIRPSDSITGAYKLEYYCNQLKNEDVKQTFNIITSTTNNLKIFCSIKWCMKILDTGLITARKSIVLAAKTNPLYGVLFTIGHMLSNLKISQIIDDNEWRNLIKDLIILCKNLTQCVGPIVNSSSPEGHLPNDFSEVPNYLNTEENIVSKSETINKIVSQKQNVKFDGLKTTSQMILLCAWRTIKEVSLILGEIVSKASIQSDFENCVIDPEQCIEIGIHFKMLLSETKHRGAFEQAYVGFVKLCARLWGLPISELNQLPMIWLKELIDIISNDEKMNEKICATRRSAGVPFMVQAIIISELKLGTTKALQYCMNNLIVLCSNHNSTTEARTHSLNILRALFRCTDLNEGIGEYIVDGVICSIRCYSSNIWSERNSSTLLFSSLITRIFGVQHTKDTENLNIRNKMTGHIFFLRYPQLYDFFLNELEDCNSLIASNDKATKLQPLLLILSRLYPSGLEGTQTNLKLSTFIPLMSMSSASPEMQTRILTAKAINALISWKIMEIRIDDILENLKIVLESNKINFNYIHGLLLQILYYIKVHRRQMLEEFGNLLIDKLFILIPLIPLNAVIFKSIVDIFLEIFARGCSSLLSNDSKKNLLILANQEFFQNNKFNYYYPDLRKSIFLYNLYILNNFVDAEAIKNFLITTLKNLKSVEEIETCLNIIILIFKSENDSYQEFECFKNEVDYIKTLKKSRITEIRNDLRKNLILGEHLRSIVTKKLYYPECAIKSYTILSEINGNDLDLCQLIQNANQHFEDVKNSITKCIQMYTKKNMELNQNELMQCLKYLFEISKPWNSNDSLRLTAANILENLSKPIINSLEMQDTSKLVLFTNVTLRYLRDDDFEVREIISRMIKNISDEKISCDNVTETYAQRMFLRKVAKYLKIMNRNDCKKAIQEIIKSQMDSHLSSATTEDEIEIFDKNELNIFGESYKTILDCIDIFIENLADKDDILEFIYAMNIV